jgi:5-methylcytosine-specific restriction endonuclease McrA
MNCNHERKGFKKFKYEVKGETRWHKGCQCLDCGERIKSPTGGIWWPKDFGEKIEMLPEWDLDLLSRNVDKKQEQKREEYRKERISNHEEYENYILRSDEWQSKREKVLWRCRGLCEACLINKATQIHHLNYDSLFNEVLWDLKGVCADCHKKIHGIKK